MTDGTEYASYQVDEIGTIFDEEGANLTDGVKYNKALKVYGILDDGKKSELSSNEYTVSAPVYLDYTADVDGKNDHFKLNGTAATTPATGIVSDVPYATNANEHKANVTVTINATGQQFTQEVTISKVKPTVKALKVVEAGVTPADQAEFNKLDEIVNVTSSTIDNLIANTLVDFAVVDSYGAVHTLADGNTNGFIPEIKLVGTPAVANTVTMTNQNGYNLTISDLEKDEKVTVAVTVNGVTKSFVVTGTGVAPVTPPVTDPEVDPEV